ncbi:MAG: protein phosphatase 2C domain-containing protein [Ruminococcus flavefaciens]|nr:protein phosphatase 2C domain-containing protein [Ruminococcus flavefaciens]
MFNGFCHTVIGASHITSGTVCQDSSVFRQYENYGIAVVADGHGSKKHFRSDKGSEMAVKAALDTVEEFYRNPEAFEESFLSDPDNIIKKMEKNIISRWNRLVIHHYTHNPYTDKEKEPFTEKEFKRIKVETVYGTTLVVAVMGRKFTFGTQIGDGSLVLICEDAAAEMPIAYEENAPANITASMCNSQAINYFNSFYAIDEKPIAVFVSTDGLYTSFRSDEDFLDYHSILANQLSNIETFSPSIRKNLSKRAQCGTQDDTSLSCVFDCEVLAEKLEDLKEQVEVNKIHASMRKAEQKARMEKQRLKNSMNNARYEYEENSIE